MGTETKIYLPDLGDFQDVAVIEVLVAPGDRVAVETSLLTLESDKATMEIPSPHAGTVRQVLVKVGDKISQGHLIAILDTEPVAAAPADASGAEAAAPGRRRGRAGAGARAHGDGGRADVRGARAAGAPPRREGAATQAGDRQADRCAGPQGPREPGACGASPGSSASISPW